MIHSLRNNCSILRAAAVAAALGASAAGLQAQEKVPHDGHGTPVLTVTAEIALNSLMSLADANLQKLADVLTLVASTDAARSADWNRLRASLADAARINVPAVYWFALPDGSYWTLETGRATGNLSDRPYFPRVFAGQTVIGNLVVSKATNRSTAIVAVPVRGTQGQVVGALGASVYLDSLSGRIQHEMGLARNHLFYTLDAEPVVGLHVDPEIILFHPLDERDPALSRAIRQILDSEIGSVTYDFRGNQRSVVYRKSAVTGWWYVFGLVQPSVITSR
jgi:hypothetical protein